MRERRRTKGRGQGEVRALGSLGPVLLLLFSLLIGMGVGPTPDLYASTQAVSSGPPWNWAVEAIDPAQGTGRYASLRLFPSGRNAAVAYYDETGSDLKYAYHDGERWQVETVDSSGDVGQYASLVLDAEGRPRIAYYDAVQGDLKYAFWTGSSWGITMVDHFGDVGRCASLALDASGHPRIAYYDATSGDLKHAAWTGSSWSITTVDGPGGDVGQYASLALDAEGRPHIAYYDATLGDLKYAVATVGGMVEVVDSSGNVGQYASLALDAGGLPHIAYYDASSGDLKYAHYDGTMWRFQTVYTQGSVGLYASLALDVSGRPYIAFYDETEGSLKWAYICSPPEASFEVSPAPYCVGETVSFTNTTVSTWTVSYLWSFGDGVTSTLSNPTHAYLSAGTFPVVLTAATGCGTDTFTRTLPVWDAPTASFEHSSPACVGRAVAFTSTSQVSGTAFYLWDFGDGTITKTTNPTHTYTAAGAYQVKLQVGNECGGDTAREWLTVYDVPAASFEHGPNPSCGTVVFTNTASGAVSFLWDFGDGITSTVENPVHTYASGGFYTVTLSAWGVGGCMDTAASVQEVWTGVYGTAFSVAPTLPVQGSVLTFTAQAEGTPPVSFLWDFGDGGTGSGPVVTHTYAAVGTYTVVLTASNACGMEAVSATLVVGNPPQADFTSNSPVCLGEPTTFTNTTTGTPSFTYLWDFGDGATSPLENPTHTYALPGVYTVTLTATNPWGRSRTEGRAGVWDPAHDVAVTVEPVSPAPGEVVTFTAQASGTPPLSFTWDLGDGSVGFGPVVTHTYAATGTYTVVLTATNACGASSAQAEIEVALCIAPAGLALTYAPQPLFRGQIATFTATLSSAGSALVHYLWSFGDGSAPAEGPVVQHTYVAAGRYTATLSVWNDCGSLQGILPVEVLAPHFQVYLPLVARNLSTGDAYEPDNVPEQGKLLLLGQPQRHSFTPEGDVDWLYLNLTAGTTYYIETRDLAGGADPILELYVRGHYDSPLVRSDDDCGGFAACFEFTPPLSGRYDLRVANYKGGAHWGPEVQYTLEVTVR